MTAQFEEPLPQLKLLSTKYIGNELAMFVQPRLPAETAPHQGGPLRRNGPLPNSTCRGESLTHLLQRSLVLCLQCFQAAHYEDHKDQMCSTSQLGANSRIVVCRR